ncbi:DUF3800 domain-containing protein [Jannaschia sp. KMU-145]|uniref:DUF3800 domain-containing protein n=1 Tax=Jannaschia halovivens TaxID=3388667 RepID=UPI00396AF911
MVTEPPAQTDRYLFSDEAGCFTFARRQNVSRYFILCTVTMSDLSVSEDLAQLRRDLLWRDIECDDYFHATTDTQQVRNAVYEAISGHSFRVQATVCEKSKAQPQVRETKARFYKYPWFYHFKFGISPRLKAGDRLLVTAAAIGSKKEKLTFSQALSDTIGQSAEGTPFRIDFRPAKCDPCLQVADYCAWAIQRQWERGDDRSYKLIQDRITYEYELWEKGQTHYY